MNPNIYTRLGIKTVINGQGTYTTLGGSVMPPEVTTAMKEAAGWFVSIPELQEKAVRELPRSWACQPRWLPRGRPRRSRWAPPRA